MTLPVTITGVAPDLATVGPYQSSGGNFYFFGKDASVATTLRCMKATDPTVSWSSIATNTGFATAIEDLVGCQDGDLIHLVIIDHYNIKYRTFNMATDAFVLSETALADYNPGSSPGTLSSLVVRSGSSPVVLFQTVAGAYGRIKYTRRTGVNTWSSPVEVDDGGTDSYSFPLAILGDSDEIQFVYSNGNYLFQRALDSDDNLQTSSNTSPTVNRDAIEGISFSYSGATRCIVAPREGRIVYFDAGDTPTLNLSSNTTNGFNWTVRLFVRNAIAYILYSKPSGSNYDYYVRSSSDGGDHWTADTFVCSSTADGKISNNSRFAKLYPAIDDTILPFIYVDNAGTTVKHNHKVVATTAVNLNFPASAISAGTPGSFGRSQQNSIDAATSAAVASDPPKSISSVLGPSSAIGQSSSVIAEGGSVSVNLAGAVATIPAAGLGIGLESEGVGGGGQVTRLGPGGYPIAALPGGAAPPTVSVSLFSATSSAAVAAPSSYELSFVADDAAATATAGLGIWTTLHQLVPISSTGGTAAARSSIRPATLSSTVATASQSDLGPSVYFRFLDITVVGFAAANDFSISIGKNVDLEAAATTGATSDVVAFMGQFVALDSAFATAASSDVSPSDAILIPSAATIAVASDIHFEGDETFSLASAAAAGVVGDLTCAIIIPSTAVICTMNAAMTANNLGAAVTANDLGGAIGIGSLVAAMATGALRTEVQTGSMQTSIRCH